ncbi:hypothetical protein QYE76_051239 [Lolium multiflorum]|uniref:Uncharacterized protein n=1 Tax=Lolium multiflorum TaxID=4521 RepID=A0AAD8SRI5_LOLMU|nr:hypothetical protein QYE76_051232 [Lolium multiflorum]KAK1663074.1 hypothetical protein QYE76_051233 [Lolium multiflorum]KAK1663079.1 hypothetical protein QYE76_051238 [Lolium multiflorum]KAK1663080.1 hypothetical protein QYE76_051239 [Lolium multiflorum]
MKEAELMRGNLFINMSNSGSFNEKRRWDYDVVFKNQANGETKTPKPFMNDPISRDFHRKFLHRTTWKVNQQHLMVVEKRMKSCGERSHIQLEIIRKQEKED